MTCGQRACELLDIEGGVGAAKGLEGLRPCLCRWLSISAVLEGPRRVLHDWMRLDGAWLEGGRRVRALGAPIGALAVRRGTACPVGTKAQRCWTEGVLSPWTRRSVG